MRQPTRALFALAAVSLLGTACGGDDEPAAATAETATVSIQTFDFQPDPLTVAAGTTITFDNQDAIDHTVTAGTREVPTPEVFDGKLPEQGATFDLTLDEPGTYDYFCRIHPGPGMTGQIVVE